MIASTRTSQHGNAIGLFWHKNAEGGDGDVGGYSVLIFFRGGDAVVGGRLVVPKFKNCGRLLRCKVQGAAGKKQKKNSFHVEVFLGFRMFSDGFRAGTMNRRPQIYVFLRQ
jgi:hypothetical protein